MGKGLADLHKSGAAVHALKKNPAMAASVPDMGEKMPPARTLTRRYTFSVLEPDPLSPQTPALVAANVALRERKGNVDPLVSVPAMLDMSFITLQGRMDPVQAALRENPDAFDSVEHRMEYDMLNSVYKTVQNIAYHLNKLVRSLNKNDDKYNRPENGMDGLDIVSGLRGSISRSQEASKRLTQLVKNSKKMYGHESTKDVLGEEGLLILEQIEGAMTVALTKSAKLLDAMDAAQKRRAKGLLQKAAAAFFQVQGDNGSTSAVLRVHFAAWKEALNTIKEEREAAINAGESAPAA